MLNQSLQPSEIIVIDDGSTDDTGLMLRKDFPQIKTLYQTNQGVSSARNKGIHASTGDWVALLDSDDEWLPDKLAQQISALKNQSHYKICHTEEIWIRNEVRVNLNKQYQKKGGWIFNDCLPLCAISPSTVLIHRSIFEEVGLFKYRTMIKCVVNIRIMLMPYEIDIKEILKRFFSEWPRFYFRQINITYGKCCQSLK